VKKAATARLARRFASSTLTFVVTACAAAAPTGVTGTTPPATGPATAPTSRPAFLAGAATSNITPPLGLPIVGNFVEPIAERIHDELHARCLVLDDGRVRLGFVVCDNVGIAREVFDEARRQVTAATGMPGDHLLMSSTHTHSAVSARGKGVVGPEAGPSVGLDEYQAFLARRISDGVRRAISNLEPAQIGWGVAVEPRPLFNRRYKMKPGVELLNPLGGTDLVKMNPGVGNPNVVEPAGPTDPQVSFITVRSAIGDHRPISLMANYSLHYVGGVPAKDVSADYFAAFADRVQQRLGADRQDPPFVGILSNGTSGDVNNVNVLGPRPAGRQKPYEQIGKVADMVADAVLNAHAAVVYQDRVPLGVARREFTLKARRPTPELVARAKRILSGEQKPKVPNEEAYARRVLALAAAPDEVTVPLQAIRVGNLGVAALPFEVFTQTGLDVKARSPFKAAFTMELANGSYGYLPTPDQHKLGGYETWLGTSRVEEEAAPKMVDALMGMLGELKAER
jgi:neutral ceramidase